MRPTPKIFPQSCLLIGTMLLALLTALCCTDSIIEIPQPTRVVVDDGGEDGGGVPPKFIIVDATGKAWDVTHAVNEYGFDPDGFEFGLGPDAIRPILDPQLVCEGEEGYPQDNWSALVIGTELNGDARAYALADMRIHEIVDEKFGETHVAVAY